MTQITREQIQTQLSKANSLDDLLHIVEDLFLSNDLYYGHGTDNAWDEAVWLVLHALKMPLNADRSELAKTLNDADKTACIDFLYQRINDRKPLAYIFKQTTFAGLDIYVDDRVLIPRSSIVELIENQFQPWIPSNQIKSILEIGTGSACIAIAAANQFADVSVLATDISDAALAVAQINVEHYHLQEKVSLLKSDLFTAIPPQQFDIIISNPPYVDAEDMSNLPAEYLHEPSLALAAGTDGLDCVIPILQQAEQYLTPHGILILEVGNSEVALQARFPMVPFYWLEFESSEGGVMLLTYQQLKQYSAYFLQ